MAHLTGKQILDLARDLVRKNPGGIRYRDLLAQISTDHPETPKRNIGGLIPKLAIKFPKEIAKPERGLFVPTTSSSAAVGDGEPIIVSPKPKVHEVDFYEPFADYLTNELGEVTTAIAMGGAGMLTKFGTPDVVGVYKPLGSDRIKFDLEIVSAEIKIDPQQPVVAFGQAAAYRLFSAKSYVVMPSMIVKEDYSRLEALCMLFGIGLVLFDVNPAKPEFRIRVRAQRFPPDMFYVNVFAERIYQINPETFNQLFG